MFTQIEFLNDDTIAFRTAHTNVQLDLERDVRDCAIGDKGSEVLLLWAQIAAIREQTAAIREFTKLAKTQAERAESLMEGRSPADILDLVGDKFPDILKMLGAAGIGQPQPGAKVVPPGNSGS